MPMSWSSLKPQFMHVRQLTSPLGLSFRLCSLCWSKLKGSAPLRDPFRIVHMGTYPSRILNLLKTLARLFLKLVFFFFFPAYKHLQILFSPLDMSKTTIRRFMKLQNHEHSSLCHFYRHTLSAPCRSPILHCSQGFLPRSKLQRNRSIKICMSTGP